MGAAVGAADALHGFVDSLVVGGVVVAMGFVDGGQGGLVQADGGHREVSLLGQVGQVGGDERGRSRQGEVAAALGPGLEGPPGGGVHLSGVFGDAAVQGLSQPGQVVGGETGCGRWRVITGLVYRGRNERVLQGHFRPPQRYFSLIKGPWLEWVSRH